MERSERFGLVLSSVEKKMLQRLAERERISAAVVLRRLVWTEAKRKGLLPMTDNSADHREATRDGLRRHSR